VKFFAPRTGLRLATDSESPAGAGIAGSSTLIIAIASALNRLTGSATAGTLREVCQNIEAQIIRVPTGAQDTTRRCTARQRIELARRHRPQGDPVDLEDSTSVRAGLHGEPRNSGINNWEVMKAHIDGERRVHRNFDGSRPSLTPCAARWKEGTGGGRTPAAPGVGAPAEECAGITRP